MKRKFDVCEFLSNESLFGITTGCEIAQVIEIFGEPEDRATDKKYKTVELEYGHLYITVFDGIVTGVGIDMKYIHRHGLSKFDVFYFSRKSQKAMRSTMEMVGYMNEKGILYKFETIPCFPEQRIIRFPGKRTFVSHEKHRITRIGISDALMYGFVLSPPYEPSLSRLSCTTEQGRRK